MGISAVPDEEQPNRWLDRLHKCSVGVELDHDLATLARREAVAQSRQEVIIDALDENLDAAVATESPARVERDKLRLAGCNHLACVQRDFILDAAGAEGSCHFAGGCDQHSRAGP